MIGVRFRAPEQLVRMCRRLRSAAPIAADRARSNRRLFLIADARLGRWHPRRSGRALRPRGSRESTPCLRQLVWWLWKINAPVGWHTSRPDRRQYRSCAADQGRRSRHGRRLDRPDEPSQPDDGRPPRRHGLIGVEPEARLLVLGAQVPTMGCSSTNIRTRRSTWAIESAATRWPVPVA